MAPTTPFDLTRAIRHWRDNLAASPAFRGENLDELESHLRDSITALQDHGLHPEEAFIIAVRRIGNGSSLETEFAKVNHRAIMLERILWILVGLQLWPIAYNTIWDTAAAAIRWGWWTWDKMHHRIYRGNSNTVDLTSEAVALSVTVLVFWWLATANGEKHARWLASLLNRRWKQSAACVCIFFVWVGDYTLRTLPLSAHIGTAKYLHIWIGPTTHAVVLMTLTLALALKRLSVIYRERGRSITPEEAPTLPRVG